MKNMTKDIEVSNQPLKMVDVSNKPVVLKKEMFFQQRKLLEYSLQRKLRNSFPYAT